MIFVCGSNTTTVVIENRYYSGQNFNFDISRLHKV